jgi:hypothetical protein
MFPPTVATFLICSGGYFSASAPPPARRSAHFLQLLQLGKRDHRADGQTLRIRGHVFESEIPDIDQGFDPEQQAAGIQAMHETPPCDDQGAAVVALQEPEQFRFIVGRKILFNTGQ